MGVIVARVALAGGNRSRTIHDSVALAGSRDQREYSPRIIDVSFGENQGKLVLFHVLPGRQKATDCRGRERRLRLLHDSGTTASQFDRHFRHSASD
jgi:hypothetical protein